MPSTYTTNLGIEKIAVGEQSGTWGTTTNTNFDILDQAVNGVIQITLASAGTSGSPTVLDISNGSVSDGRNKFIEFVDGGDLGATAYVQLSPNDAEKIVFVRNSLSGSRSILVFQGTYNASNDFEIPNGKDVVIKFDGGGATATVTQVFDDLLVTGLSVTSLTLGGTAITSTAAELNVLDGITATTTELNYTDGVTSNIQTQLNAKAPLASPTFTGTTSIATLSLGGTTITASGTEINKLDGLTATTTELNYVDGVTSAIQTQLNAKAPTASPTFTGTTSISTFSLGGTTITASGAEINKLDGVTATTAELNYTDGVTSNIQTQLNAKAPIASPTFTGTSTVPSLVLGSGSTVTSIKDEDNMASNSNTALATQQSIKAYVDNSAVDLTAITTDVDPNTDNANDLGSAAKRWQDLYLSGGVYLGGTTSANFLDDYEKGTFTLNAPGSLLTALQGSVTGYYAEYVKIGRVVHVFGQIIGSSIFIDSGTSPGYIILGSGCLPFSTSAQGISTAGDDTFTGVVGDGSGYGLTSAGSRIASVSAAWDTNWSWGSTSFSAATINAVCTYMTDA
jgi:hypothetical protein